LPAVLKVAGATTHRKTSSVYAASELVSANAVSRRAMDSPRITYTSRPDATPEAEVNVLANVYRFIFDCHAKKMAAEPAPEPDSRDDAKE
jgi:hypothetical protein